MHGRGFLTLALFSCCALAQSSAPAPAYSGAAPIVTPPIIDLNTVSRAPVGATSATAGLETGATNSTIDNVPVTEGSVTTEAVVANAPGSQNAAKASSAVTSFNAGVGTVVGGPGGFEPLPGGQSLGEIAREYRSHKQAQTAPPGQTATVQMSNVDDSSGSAASASVPQTSSPSTTSVASQSAARRPYRTNMPATTAPASATELAQATTPQNPASVGEQSSAGNAKAAPETARQAPALPRTASPLPFLALAGFAAGGVGLWLRKRRS